MAVELFTGNVIAVIWDFDRTLIPRYQQEPLFDEFGIDQRRFWAEVNALHDYYASRDIVTTEETLYLNHLLTYVKAGLLPDLTNAKLRELGEQLELCKGMPEFMQRSREEIVSEEYGTHGITVEHYVVSTGLRQMILGSAIAEYIDGVWASEFIEEPAAPGFLEATEKTPSDDAEAPDVEGRTISQVGYFLDNTTKTRAIWEINKGVNKDSDIDVNAFMPQEDRRVPLRNMIYVADGPSDVPVFSILNDKGGATLGVYDAADDRHFEQVRLLSDQGRVNIIAASDYRDGQLACKWLLSTMRQIADLIVRDRNLLMSERVQAPTQHVT